METSHFIYMRKREWLIGFSCDTKWPDGFLWRWQRRRGSSWGRRKYKNSLRSANIADFFIYFFFPFCFVHTCHSFPGRRGLQTDAAARNVWSPWGLFAVSNDVFGWGQIKGINTHCLKRVENNKKGNVLSESKSTAWRGGVERGG